MFKSKAMQIETPPPSFTLPLFGLVLGANVDGPDPINEDTGEFTTGVPGPCQIGMTMSFGKGRGKWIEADIDTLQVALGGRGPAAAENITIQTRFENGDLVFVVHNQGDEEIDCSGLTLRFESPAFAR
jgi:hypothetical protein